MIVTSSRCFLNILTQLTPLDVLLNANYYMIDLLPQNGMGSQHVPQANWNEHGGLDVRHSQSHTMGKYNITYGHREIDPTPYITNLSMGNGYQNPIDDFIEHLNKTETMLATYQFIFKQPLKGNNLQILIIYNDESVIDCGHIICGYLSENFGVDITYIDPQYRPNVKGQVAYQGNKALAAQRFRDIKNQELVSEFQIALSQTGGVSNCITQLQVFLGQFDIPMKIHIYNLLWPHEPLPPGQYSSQQLDDLIIGKTTAHMPKAEVNNMFMTEELKQMMKGYEDQVDDFDAYDYIN